MNIEVDQSLPCVAERQIAINAPIERVFSILSDINNWTKWQKAVSISSINDKPIVGAEFSWKANGFKINSKIHTYLPSSELGWTGKMLWIDAVHNWYLTSDSKNTIVLVKESLKGFGSILLKKTLVEGMAKSLLELKTIAEE